ncbi:hypothetical protein Tsubulata_020168 [Turnera subulata]|uniref:Glycosyltransferase n=1 Tax=Turnera subulata TaxID=218843 RepID=A0A9Q0FP36_9ROSI|nr:hypothetical protein Tsubulata_020168 [Turnera subulata]
MMSSQPSSLHIAFFPYLVHGHMIPTIDMARIFARKGVKASIICTPNNASLFSKTIERDREQGYDISFLTIKFPSAEVGLPEGCEHGNSLYTEEMLTKFHKATTLLQEPLEQLLKEHNPDCLVADMMYPWATEAASSVEIPRLVFHGMSSSARCMFDCLYRYKPHKNVESDFDPFILPGLPDQITMTKLQVPPFIKEENQDAIQIFEAELNCYGVVLNSFYELEPAYIEHYRRVMGRKAWQIGPVSLCNKDNEDKLQRGGLGSIYEQVYCLTWLASKEPNSVLYICFGSRFNFSAVQFLEIAKALESSGVKFIWVVNTGQEMKSDEDNEEWLPEGFEKKMEGKGLIIRGWAPQVLILDQEATGGFMTHCGWNSILEGVAAGVPMITWPLQAEQFCNEKLVTDVLRIGVGVGAQEWTRSHERKILLRKEGIEKAVSRLMVGVEAEDFRKRAEALKEMAGKAIEQGGSSYSDLNALLEELRSIKSG